MIGRIVRKIKSAQHDLRLARRLPEPTFEVVQLALAWFLQSRGAGFFVQIGACDGSSGDPVHSLLMTSKISAILLEPIPTSFQKLQTSYRGATNVILVQAAIADYDGTLNLFKVVDGAQSIDAFWAAQLASFNKTHLLQHGVQENEIQSVSVPCLTLESLIQRNGVDRIGFLQVDTEGYDGQVVKMALRLAYPPPFIYFENVHISDVADLDNLFNELRVGGYSWVHDKWNTLAIHRSAGESLRTMNGPGQ
jgi:FkbM family methyltransferase